MKSQCILVYFILFIIISNVNGRDLYEKRNQTLNDSTKMFLEPIDTNNYNNIFSLEGGLCRRTAKISPELSLAEQNFSKQIQNGINIIGSIFTVSKNKKLEIGVNVKYSYFNHLDHSYILYDNAGVIDKVGLLQEKIKLLMVAPGFYYRKFMLNKKFSLITGALVGILIFKDEVFLIDQKYKKEGKGLGLGASIGIDYKFSKHFAFGFSTKYFNSIFNKITTDKSPYLKTVSELQNLNINIGLKIYY